MTAGERGDAKGLFCSCVKLKRDHRLLVKATPLSPFAIGPGILGRSTADLEDAVIELFAMPICEHQPVVIRNGDKDPPPRTIVECDGTSVSTDVNKAAGQVVLDFFVASAHFRATTRYPCQ